MKRSRSMKLVLMATTAVLLAGCESEPQVEVQSYASLKSCLSSGDYTQAECLEAYEVALDYHDKSAPRYDSFQLCVEQHGPNACGRSVDGGDYFTPFLMGYMVSSALDDIGDYDRRRRYEHIVRPTYRTSSGGIATSSGYTIKKNRDGKYEAPKSATAKPKPAKVQTRTSVVSRGGFGGRSSSSSRGG